jgi:hypothetical protein
MDHLCWRQGHQWPGFAGVAAKSDAATKPSFPMRLANAAQRVRTTLNGSVLMGFH